MIHLTAVQPLFDEKSSVPQDTLKRHIVEDFKLKSLAGVSDGRLEISFNPEEGSDILIKSIDPHAAAGYLVFKDDGEYNDWLGAQLYEPSQEEMEEALERGARS